MVEQYVKKGSKVYIEGSLQTRKWTDQAGVEKYSTEVVIQGFGGTLTMLDSRNSSGAGAGYGGGDSFGQSGPMDKPGDSGGATSSQPQNFNRDLDDEVPF